MQKLNKIAICRGRRPRRPIAVLYIFLPRAWRQEEHLLLQLYLRFLRINAGIRHAALREGGGPRQRWKEPALCYKLRLTLLYRTIIKSPTVPAHITQWSFLFA